VEVIVLRQPINRDAAEEEKALSQVD